MNKAKEKDEQYWKGYIAALRWVKGWWGISWDATKALNEKIREIKKKWQPTNYC